MGITRTEFDLVLRVNGVEYRCANHTSTFALNRIPLASCTLAVGRDARNLQQARVHSSFGDFKAMQSAEVLLRPKGYWGAWQGRPGDNPDTDDGLWTTAGERVVFRGYLTGVGYTKIRGELRVSVQLVHWLSDLAFSSIFSNQSHPENPSQYTFRATFPAELGPGAGEKSNFIGGTRFDRFIRPGGLRDDLWKNLANIFCLAVERGDMIQLGGPERCGGREARNDQSLAALKRFEGDHNCADNDNAWHVKLSMAGLGQQGFAIAKAIRSYIAQQSLNSWWATTIWDKLIHDFAPAFLFHVVPRVETAVVAPFCPGLREPYRVSLDPRDMGQLNISAYIRRPLRGVGVFAGREFRTVATDRQARELTSLSGIGGCFMPDPDAKGMVLLKRAPFWITNVPALGTRPRRTIMGKVVGAGPAATSTALTPVDNENLRGGEDDNKTGGEKAAETADVYNRLAHYMYVQEVLRGRQGTCSGKLRYDIAPGSNISFFVSGDPHINNDALRGQVYASVMRVANAIDAEARQGVTTFSLAHLRSSEENQDEKTSVESHPLYEGQRYLGAPLVDQYLFDEEP